MQLFDMPKPKAASKYCIYSNLKFRGFYDIYSDVSKIVAVILFQGTFVPSYMLIAQVV